MKKVNLFIKYLLVLTVVSIFTSGCNDDDGPLAPIIPPTTSQQLNVLILNEGDWGYNNAGLSYYNPATGNTIADIYNKQLGAIAQNMALYGNKLYIAVSESNIISVIEKTHLIEIDKIEMKVEGLRSLAPRYIETYDGKIYVTCQESGSEDAPRNGYVMRIDTTSLKIEAYTKVGLDPEDLTAYEGKLYVANSESSNYPNVGKTLSIVDIETFKEEEKIEVGTNPYRVKADNKGNIYLTYQGVFGVSSGGFQRINTTTKEVINIANYPKQDFQIFQDKIYFYDVTYTADNSVQNGIGVFDMTTQNFIEEPFISDGTKIMNTPYGIGINPETEDVYVSTTNFATRGKVLIFNKEGKKTKELTVGINPNMFVFF